MKRTTVAILAAIGLAAAGPPVEKPRVPCDVQFNLTIKVLAFDRNLDFRAGDEIVFGILYEEGDPVSLREKSIRDPLTGPFNRRYMEETLDREIRREDVVWRYGGEEFLLILPGAPAEPA